MERIKITYEFGDGDIKNYILKLDQELSFNEIDEMVKNCEFITFFSSENIINCNWEYVK